MKVSEEIIEVNPIKALNIGVDVASKKLDIYFEVQNGNTRKVYREKIPNRSTDIIAFLHECQVLADANNFTHVQVVCEPTGPYAVNLLSSALSHNCLTAFVNPEAVHKSKVIETNSSGKTDLIDAKVIFRLAQQERLLIHRIYSKEYGQLREYGKHYDDVENDYTRARNHIASTLQILWPDYSSKIDNIYSKAGQTLFAEYGFNPWLIIKQGKTHFFENMRKKSKGVRNSTLEKLWSDAEATCQHNNSDLASDHQEIFAYHYELYLHCEDRKKWLQNKMKQILKVIRQSDENIPAAQVNFVSELNIARLLGETGPLRDFKSYEQLQNYLGMNLRERQSGDYKGKTQLSKKGRPLGRKILSQIVLPLVKTSRLYGPAYHKKREETGKPGTLVMTNFMRKFLKSFRGIYFSNEQFDLMRLFIDKGAYHKLYKTA
jgi:transposase